MAIVAGEGSGLRFVPGIGAFREHLMLSGLDEALAGESREDQPRKADQRGGCAPARPI